MEVLAAKNPSLRISPCTSASFEEYGRLVGGIDTGNLVDRLNAMTHLGEGTSYQRSLTGLEDLPGPRAGRTWKQYFSATIFGGLSVQVGSVSGRNARLNALEYHKSSEVLVAGTDLVLLLGRLGDIKDHRSYDADLIDAFFVSRGQAIETWSSTLHGAPSMVSSEPFSAAIVLPTETNAPLEAVDTGAEGELGRLWALNKWLIACPDSPPAKKGAKVGIGRNIEVAF